MIQLSSAGKHFGPKTLFEDLDWLITPQERISLVGANGTGKSTLLKVLAGLDSLDYGSITRAKGITAGYLPQDGLSLSGRSVLAECLSVFDRLRAMEPEMEALTHQMSELDPDGDQYERVADRYHRLESEFSAHDGYRLEAQAATVLSGLGFPREDWSRPTEEFSGGWQMRIALAKLLLEKPNLLLLDEPTNHLDLEARNWLEDFLASYPFACVLVSHDRYFLDVTVKKTVELWNHRAHFYSGNYDRYLQQKAERQAQIEAAYRNQQERVQQLEVFINRFRYQATKAKQVQSRIKELERMERVEVPPQEKTIHFSFPQPKPSGHIVAEFKGVAKSYGEKLVFRNVDFIIDRGDRVALVGVNGAGKSTLIKLLAGTEPVTRGELRLGHNVEVDYFAQDQYKALDANARVLDDLASIAPAAVSGQTQLRSLLGCFLFSEDDVFKRIGVLSGGERNRYALARMLLQPSNFLLLDEPTNYLDMRAKDVLLEALEKFKGTVVFVSHDRYFIDKLATRVFEIEAGRLHVFPGNYEDYLWRKQAPESSVARASRPLWRERPAPARKDEPASNGHGRQSDRSPAAGNQPPAEVAPAGKRLNPILARQMQKRAKELEEEIARCEAEIAEGESQLAQFRSQEESARLGRLVKDRRVSLEELWKEWEQVSQAVESER